MKKVKNCLDHYDGIMDKKLHLERNLSSDYKFLLGIGYF
jgi:hypothetical protein